MGRIHKGRYCPKKNWVDKTIGYPQSQANRKITVPIPGEKGEKGEGILAVDTVEELRNLSEEDIKNLQDGVYKSVQLNGYYQAGDTPNSIQYYLSDTEEEDDGGSVFDVGGVKLEHKFVGGVDPKYFGAKANGVDSDVSFVQKVVDKYRCTVLSAGTWVLDDTILMGGVKKIRSQSGSVIDITKQVAGNSVFKNKDNSTLIIYVDDVLIRGCATIFDLQLHGSTPNAGLAAYLNNIMVNGLSRIDGATFLKGRQIDFLSVNNIRLNDFGIGLDIQSDFTLGERDNTQLFGRNVYMDRVNVGARYQQCDKVDMSIDIATCATGFIFQNTNKRIRLTTSHVENFGATGYTTGNPNLDGYAYMVPTDTDQKDIQLINSSAFPLGSSGAKSGLYVGRHTSNNKANVIAEYCDFSPVAANSPAYKAITAYGQLTWKGEFKFTGSQVALGTIESLWGDFCITEGADNAKVSSNNLLYANKVMALKNMSGDFTYSKDVEGVVREGYLLSSTVSSELYEIINLKKGWHTLVVSGYKKTGDIYPYVQDNGGSFSTILMRRLSSINSFEKIYRYPFYISEDRTVRVGFYSYAGASSAVIGSFACVEGFGNILDVKSNYNEELTVVGTRTLTLNDYNAKDKLSVLVNASNNITITLPPLALARGLTTEFIRVDSTSNVVTIKGSGSEIIDDSNSFELESNTVVKSFKDRHFTI